MAMQMSASADVLIEEPQVPVKDYDRAFGELAVQYGSGVTAPVTGKIRNFTRCGKDLKLLAKCTQSRI